MSNDIQSRVDRLAANVQKVRARISAACQRSGRVPESVSLVAVTKTFPVEIVNAAIAAGLTDIGENRVQELAEKIAGVRGRARLHMIGHLQSNKARQAVELFDVIETVHSASLAEKIGREAVRQGKRMDVLVQVNVGREPQKSGVLPEDVTQLCRAVQRVEGLSLLGLMTIPPMAEERETREYFRLMVRLRDEARNETGEGGLRELSMGMSDDFEMAIEEGATIVRLGSVLFGSRG